jgi:hypothetical protein
VARTDSLGKCLIEPGQRNDNGRISRLENGRIGAAQRARFASGESGSAGSDGPRKDLKWWRRDSSQSRYRSISPSPGPHRKKLSPSARQRGLRRTRRLPTDGRTGIFLAAGFLRYERLHRQQTTMVFTGEAAAYHCVGAGE